MSRSKPSLWPFWSLLVFCSAFCLVWGGGCACDNSPGVKTFECQDNKECSNSELCQSGKCVNADDDKDGWAKGKDCDDTNPSIYPGRREICENGKDDNCDGKVDEPDCVCEEGTERPCGLAVGECRQGKQLCLGGEWGVCRGASEPAEEICDGKDNDCDGKTDENVANCCEPGQSRPCGDFDKGECKKGSQRCEAGMWTACDGEAKPTDEICDGKDNDCDGQIDNLKDTQDPLRKDCYTGPDGSRKVGTCKDGYVLCKEGKWEEDTACQAQIQPTQELCDGQDNDCDGLVDNDTKNGNRPLEEVCYSGSPETQGKGACKDGLRRCVGGAWGPCQGEIRPVEETCNGVDDDCDGQIDNRIGSQLALQRTCFSGAAGCTLEADGSWKCVGTCKTGAQECKAGRWEACANEVLPQTELCDSLDNDCDGQVDNLAGGADPIKQACFSGDPDARQKGECKDGEQTCTAGQWGACTGDTLPKPEVCDGKDNDCNGQIDDAIPPGQACPTGLPGICASGALTCINSQLVCRQTVQGTSESCDGLDNNCDGRVDEIFPELGQNCQVPNAQGECSRGTYTQCVGGRLICAPIQSPTTEQCGDNKDNDCDGKVDENPPCECVPGARRACYTGPSGTQGVGVCSPGEQFCISGRWGSCSGQTVPSTESCNGRDDDCDGTIDDGNPGGGGSCSITSFPVSAPCRTGVQNCRSGSLQCIQTVFPVTEKPCNGIDDNCNGTVDEVGCSVGQQCSGGACQTCSQPGDRTCSEFLGVCTSTAPCPTCNCGYVCTCVNTDAFGTCQRRSCRRP